MFTALALLFLIALGISVVLTPFIRELGIRIGAMDIPMDRKIHKEPIPRTGGVVLFFSFIATILLSNIFVAPVSDLFVLDSKTIFFLCGALVVFGCGLWDDFHRLNPWIKLIFQIAGATLAFMGGASIKEFSVGSHGVEFGLFGSYVLTVFWFLLFINAVNLIDGLDGLAGGVVFFTSLLMTFLSYKNGDYLSAFYFSVMAGAILGFLRYNFNPASIFLGDGGSYLLGYAVAILAIFSSMKSQVGALMLIPLLAMGVPIFDTIVSPIRRFLQGREIFQPDKGHVHHIFLRSGLSSKNTVLVIYGITMGLCLLSILLITVRGKGYEGLLFGVLLFGLIFLVRKLGYLEYLAFDKFYGWFLDMTDVAGISHERRSFISVQMMMIRSQNMDELWESLISAVKMIKFDCVELHLEPDISLCWEKSEESDSINSGTTLPPKREIDSSDGLMRVEIPLCNGTSGVTGKLILLKDIKKEPLKPYTIRRIENLRRTLIDNLKRLKSKQLILK